VLKYLEPILAKAGIPAAAAGPAMKAIQGYATKDGPLKEKLDQLQALLKAKFSKEA
jgi:hypothetical protein